MHLRSAAGSRLAIVILIGIAGLAPTFADEFQECPDCPIMVKLPAGRFLMGTAVADRLTDPRTGKPATNDGPQHVVTIDSPFAIGKYEVTVEQFAAFVAATDHDTSGGCMEFSPEATFKISEDFDWDKPGFEQAGNAPVGCVSFFDAQAYAAWLSDLTGEIYRLPSEAEWEYAARAGSTGPYHWGSDRMKVCSYANVRSPGAHTISKRQLESDRNDGFPCDDGMPLSSPAGSFAPNDFGLHDMQGNAWEWVADCNHKDYEGAPADGGIWVDELDEKGGCQFGVIRGGSFLNLVERSSVTVRAGRPQTGRATNMGFRVARGGKTKNTSESDWSAAPNTGSELAASQDANSAGARLFSENCAACHMVPTAYRGIYGTDQQSVEAAISGGGNNVMSMPAFGEVLTADEISELAKFVRALNGWE
ncbi:MAG: SUMF1/EgtB/PvdO family nonheme iron enzyme [Gammaproteobacteria bacterium]|nr:SUMF1/EgtB/PvdO family nonheme iron enzyme [Gammaproteobacteria bacterium]